MKQKTNEATDSHGLNTDKEIAMVETQNLASLQMVYENPCFIRVNPWLTKLK